AHDGVLVRHEMLETVDAVVAHQTHHVRAHRLVPPRDRDVEGVIRAGFFGPSAPILPGVHDPLLRVRDHEVDYCRCAAGYAGGGAREEVVARHRAHERQLHVRVWIDAARHHELSACVDDFTVAGGVQSFTDGDDLAVGAQHVAPEGLIGGDDGAALDEYRHCEPRLYATTGSAS